MTRPALHIPQKDSPSTFLSEPLGDDEDRMTVTDSSIFKTDPDNLITRLTLNFDGATTETVEVVQYVSGNIIVISRSRPSYAWPAGTKVARVFTAKDANEYIQYFNYLNDERELINSYLNSLNQNIINKINPIIALNNNPSGRKFLFRGNYIGSELASSQASAINNGTFTNLYLGDYWTIGGVNYRIADFNYWGYGLGGNHLVIVPDIPLLNREMDQNSESSIPYYNADIRPYIASTILPILQSAFGGRVGMYYENLYSNSSQFIEVLARVELMNESMVYGQGIHRTNHEPTYSFQQLALFRARPEFITSSTIWWLRDQADTNYCAVLDSGMAGYTANSMPWGIRPCFPLLGVLVEGPGIE